MEKQQFPGWLPVQVAQHYGFPLDEWDGDGQSIAILSFGGKLDRKELRRDFKALRVPFPKLTIVDVAREYITDQQNNAPTAETHLDLEVVASICPKADIHIFRGPLSFDVGFPAAINAAIDAGCSVISLSWGGTEAPGFRNSDIERALRRAKAEHVTVCVSSGDRGSGGVGPGNVSPDGWAHVQYPASSPYVLACGGTQLMMDSEGYHEAAWNNSSMNRGATGGGVSEYFAKPSWQVAGDINLTSVNSGHSGRVVPDVAGLASCSWKIFEQSAGTISGGTSAVTPLYAGFLALVNQKRASLGKANLGFINRRLYTLAAKGGVFHDITEGDNKPTDWYPGYRARRGFDACTGWGVPRGQELFDALVKLR